MNNKQCLPNINQLKFINEQNKTKDEIAKFQLNTYSKHIKKHKCNKITI